MSDTIDRVLEAETSILQLLDELQQMKSAAETLAEATNQSKAVVEAASSVLDTTERLNTTAGQFAIDSAAILDRLSKVDLEKRLDQVVDDSAGLRSDLKEGLEAQRAEITETAGRLTGSIGAIRSSIESATAELGEKVDDVGANLKVDVLSALTALDTKVKHIQTALESLQKTLKADIDAAQDKLKKLITQHAVTQNAAMEGLRAAVEQEEKTAARNFYILLAVIIIASIVVMIVR